MTKYHCIKNHTTLLQYPFYYPVFLLEGREEMDIKELGVLAGPDLVPTNKWAECPDCKGISGTDFVPDKVIQRILKDDELALCCVCNGDTIVEELVN